MYRDEYERWLQFATDDFEITDELNTIRLDEDAIQDRFYRDLQFGTGGLRGIIGAGSNRMNSYTVKKATQGLSDYIKEKFDHPGVAIAYDSRKNSDVFARAAACVFAANGITSHIYRELMPTPMLSFAVRRLKLSAGIVITASHNPAKYNGYKVYGSDGCQITLEAANAITGHITDVDIFSGVLDGQYDDFVKKGFIKIISREIEKDYFSHVLEQSMYDCDGIHLSVVYSPLNGAGNKPVVYILNAIGMHDVIVVPEQENPDSSFDTCPYPNPEEKETLHLAVELAGRIDADLVLATDPDCDRVGTAIKHDGSFILLNGNQMGVLLLDFICRMRKEQGRMPANPLAIKTIVTTEMAQIIADHYGVVLMNVLTGFKFIGELIGVLEQKGEEDRYIFGFEESYGYLTGSYVRDKDAVVASMLICQMAAYYKKQGKTLVTALNDLYLEFGYFYEKLTSFAFEGMDGMEKMQEIMKSLRNNPPLTLGDCKIKIVRDYSISKEYEDGKCVPIDLPSSDVMGFFLAGGSSVIVRPSGTEPKLKIYYSLKCKDKSESEALFEQISGSIKSRLKA